MGGISLDWLRYNRLETLERAAGISVLVVFGITALSTPAAMVSGVRWSDTLAWQAMMWVPWTVFTSLLAMAAWRLHGGPADTVPYRMTLLCLLAAGSVSAHWAWGAMVIMQIAPDPGLREWSVATGYFLTHMLPMSVVLAGASVLFGVLGSRHSFGFTDQGLLDAGTLAGRAAPRAHGGVASTPLVVVERESGLIVAVNEAAGALYGHEPLAMQGMAPASLAADHGRHRFLKDLEESRNFLMWGGRCDHRHADGRMFPAEYTVFGIEFLGRPAMLVLVEDRSELERAEHRIKESERHAAELRTQLSEAHLRALKLQVRPHFLFNVLNAVSMLMRTGQNARARETLARLSTLFRAMLEHDQQHRVSLARELALLETYLSLEHLRFQDRMSLDWHIENAPGTAQVPALILQPLAENAIKHGVARSLGPAEIQVRAWPAPGRVVIEIENTVPPESDVSPVGFGVGTRNVRERLATMYGDGAGLELIRRSGRFIARLDLPLEEE